MIKVLPVPPNPGSVSPSSLHSFIAHLLDHPLAESIRRSGSLVTNNIPTDFGLKADGQKVLPVIEDLLSVVVQNARKGDITVRAEKFRDILILEIEDSNNYNGYALDYSLRSLESAARLAGGYISATGQQKLVSTVSFSFPHA